MTFHDFARVDDTVETQEISDAGNIVDVEEVDTDVENIDEIHPPRHDAMIEAFNTLSNYLKTNDVPIAYHEF